MNLHRWTLRDIWCQQMSRTIQSFCTFINSIPNTHKHTHTYTRMRAHTRPTHIHTNACTCTRAYTHAYIYTYTYRHTHANKLSLTHTHSHMHRQTQTHTRITSHPTDQRLTRDHVLKWGRHHYWSLLSLPRSSFSSLHPSTIQHGGGGGSNMTPALAVTQPVEHLVRAVS